MRSDPSCLPARRSGGGVDDFFDRSYLIGGGGRFLHLHPDPLPDLHPTRGHLQYPASILGPTLIFGDTRSSIASSLNSLAVLSRCFRFHQSTQVAFTRSTNPVNNTPPTFTERYCRNVSTQDLFQVQIFKRRIQVVKERFLQGAQACAQGLFQSRQ